MPSVALLFTALAVVPATAFLTNMIKPIDTRPATEAPCWSHHRPQGSAVPTSDGRTTDGRADINWVVRPASPQDELHVTRLLQSSYATLLAHDYSQQLLDKALPLITRANPNLLTCPTWFVVEHPDDNGRIVGCGGWTPHSPQTTPSTNDDAPHSQQELKVMTTPHLRHFATDPKCARRGIGSALWRHVLGSLRRELGGGGRSATLEMEVYSTITAVPFYEACGFDKMRQTTVPLSADCAFPCWLMNGTFSLGSGDN